MPRCYCWCMLYSFDNPQGPLCQVVSTGSSMKLPVNVPRNSISGAQAAGFYAETVC